MNTGFVRIFNFDRDGDRYLFKHPGGPLQRVKGDEWDGDQTDWSSLGVNAGCIKKYLIGRDVLVYTVDRTPYINVGGVVERLVSRDVVKQYKFGPFCFCYVKCGRIRSFSICTQWFDFILRFIDPAYDFVDEIVGDFSAYVNRVFERSIDG